MGTVSPISRAPPLGSVLLETIPCVFTDAATQILPGSGSLTVGMFLKVLACSFLRYSLHRRRKKKKQHQRFRASLELPFLMWFPISK